MIRANILYGNIYIYFHAIQEKFTTLSQKQFKQSAITCYMLVDYKAFFAQRLLSDLINRAH